MGYQSTVHRHHQDHRHQGHHHQGQPHRHQTRDAHPFDHYKKRGYSKPSSLTLPILIRFLLALVREQGLYLFGGYVRQKIPSLQYQTPTECKLVKRQGSSYSINLPGDLDLIAPTLQSYQKFLKALTNFIYKWTKTTPVDDYNLTNKHSLLTPLNLPFQQWTYQTSDWNFRIDIVINTTGSEIHQTVSRMLSPDQNDFFQNCLYLTPDNVVRLLLPTHYTNHTDRHTHHNSLLKQPGFPVLPFQPVLQQLQLLEKNKWLLPCQPSFWLLSPDHPEFKTCLLLWKRYRKFHEYGYRFYPYPYRHATYSYNPGDFDPPRFMKRSGVSCQACGQKCCHYSFSIPREKSKQTVYYHINCLLNKISS